MMKHGPGPDNGPQTAKGRRAAARYVPRRVRGPRVPGPVVLRDPVRRRATVSPWSRSPCSSSTGPGRRCSRPLAYAAGYLPWVIGGLFLADVADRLSAPHGDGRLRRRPGRPGRGHGACRACRSCALVALLFATTMFAPPFESARAAITPDILQGELYVLGAGGDPDDVPGRPGGRRGRRGNGGGLHRRPPGARHRRRHVRALRLAHRRSASGPGRRRQAGNRPVVAAGPHPPGLPAGLRRPALRTLLLLGWLVVFYTVPEGIAAPYATRLGGGPIATGLVLASTVFATTIATPLFTRFVRARQRLTLMGPLAVLTCATLVLTALHPGLVVSLGDLLPVGRVRHVPDRGQYRLCRQGAERAAVSGIRHRQHGCGRWPGGRIRGGRAPRRW